jgi:hypothetical protein
MFGGPVLQKLYGGSPNVSFFKGDGEPQLGPILDMPDNSSSGAVCLGVVDVDISPSLFVAAGSKLSRCFPTFNQVKSEE